MTESGTLVNADTGEVIAECTPDEARLLTDRMHTGIGVLTELYVEAYQRRAWAALGYPSWDAYLAAEFGKYQLRLPAEERDETITSLRSAGLSIRAIAATGVASKKTVERTIAASGVANDDTSTIGTDGKTYDAVSRAKAQRDATPAPVEPGKCIDGFDCPAVPGPDGRCAWHRGRAAANAAQSPSPEVPAPSVTDEPEQDPQPVPAPNPPGQNDATSPAVDAVPVSDGTAHAGGPVAELPDDWRDRIAYATHLLGCPTESLRLVLTDDDRIDLTDLRDYLTTLLEEQNA